MQRMGLRTRPRQKYSAARAFYLTLVVVLAITIWSFANGKEAAPAKSNTGLLPRDAIANLEGFSSFTNDPPPGDLEVYRFSLDIIIQLLEVS